MTQANRITNVCATLAAMLEEWEPLRDIQARVTRAAEPEEDPNRCPWVGIYRVASEFEGRTIGLGAGHRRQLDDLLVMARESDGTSGAECEARLETLVSGILDCVLSDPSLRGTVQMVEAVKVTYDDYRMVGDEYFQSASISLRCISVTV